MRLSYNNLGNFLLFQAGWFIGVLSAANNIGTLGVSIVIILLIVHLKFCARIKAELTLLFCVAAIGFAVDSINLNLGVFELNEGQLDDVTLAPAWLVSLWTLFASTLNYSLNWLKHKSLIALFLGAVFAPIAYYGGVKLGALSLNPHDPELSLAVIAFEWAVLTPLLFKLNFNKY